MMNDENGKSLQARSRDVYDGRCRWIPLWQQMEDLAMPSVSEYFPCEDGVVPRKLSIRKVLERRPVTICLQHSSILPLSMLVLQVLFHYENLRWLYHGALKKICCSVSGNAVGGGKEEVLPVKGNSRKAEVAWNFWRYFVLTMAAIYPIFYNHDMVFMYVNDNWKTLLAVQIFFTVSDDLCYLCRWFDVYPEFRAVVRAAHIFFNVAAEKENSGARNILFLIDDFVSLYDIYYFYHAGRITLQKKRLLLCLVAVVFSWVMVLGVVNSNDNMNIS